MECVFHIGSERFIVRKAHNHADLKADWHTLETTGLLTPYQTYAFVSSWLDTFGQLMAVEPCLVSVHDTANTIKAILPLVIYKHMGVRVARFIGEKHANFHMGLFDASFLKALTPEKSIELFYIIATQLSKIDCGHFDHQPPSWEDVFNPFAHHHAQEMSASCIYIKCQGEDGEQALENLFKKETKRKRDSKLKRLAEAGEVKFQKVLFAEDADDFLKTMEEQRQKRQRIAGVPNVFEEIGMREFCQAFLKSSLNQTFGSIAHYLQVGEEIVATEITVTSKKRWSGMIISMTSSELSKHSPGEHLFIHCIEDAIVEDVQIFDFGAGMAHYKSRFSSDSHPLMESFLPVSLLGYVYCFGRKYVSALKVKLKNNEQFMALLKKLRKK